MNWRWPGRARRNRRCRWNPALAPFNRSIPSKELIAINHGLQTELVLSLKTQDFSIILSIEDKQIEIGAFISKSKDKIIVNGLRALNIPEQKKEERI